MKDNFQQTYLQMIEQGRMARMIGTGLLGASALFGMHQNSSGAEQQKFNGIKKMENDAMKNSTAMVFPRIYNSPAGKSKNPVDDQMIQVPKLIRCSV